ncbi:MAG: lipopolysaccharide biosynthesis protein [Blastochloris viridis]|uniref:Lipopolysaccharide biosynthesis protein n=1 Tax=Blastochloris viridis TaxID=1079 RepID=A0A6N4RE53_BLAVI|nr:MAG: lipopolysaccharide biosynthesis protein [Blastochloris viridis]
MSPKPQVVHQVQSPSSESVWLESLSSQSSYGRQAARSLAVLAVGQGGKLFLHVVSTMILARMLVPEDFGLIAMAATVISFLVLFKDAGLTSATIQQKDLTHTQVTTLFWLNVLVGAVLALITLASAPLLAYAYGESALIPMVCVLAAGFFLGSFGAQHDALMRRQMAFKWVTVSEMAALALGVVAAISMALAGWGWWALVAQKVVQMVSNAALNWVFCDWRPTFQFRWHEAKKQFQFGAHISGFNFVNYFSRNGDNILIGWYWGPALLGVYAKAYDLLLGPLSQISAPLQGMMQPLLGRLRDEPQRYRAAYLKVMVPANLAVLPIATLIFVMPEAVVHTLLGAGWEQANGVVMWLGLAVVFQMVGGSTGFVLISQQRSADFAFLGLMSSIITVTSFIISLPFGIQALAACYVLTNGFIIQPMLYYTISRKGPLGIAEFLYPLKFSLLCAGAMLPLMLVVKWGVSGLPSLVQLLLVGAVGGMGMITVLLLVKEGRQMLHGLYQAISKHMMKRG